MSITKITAETIRHCIYGTYKVELDTKQRVKTEQGCQEIKILAECITFPFEQWIAVGRDKKTITFTPAKKRNVQRMVNYIKKLKTKIKSAEYSGTHHKQIYNIIQPIVQNKLIEKTISTNTIFITSPPPSMCKESRSDCECNVAVWRTVLCIDNRFYNSGIAGWGSRRD